MMPPLSLVLLPGMDGTGLLFAPLLRALPAEVEPLAVAYPGDTPLPYSALAELVLEALAELPAGRDVVLLGESFSGPVALRVAATQPAGLRAVVLCASFAKKPVRVPAWVARAVRPQLLRAAPFAVQAPVMLGAGAGDAAQTLLRGALARVSPEVLAFRVAELLRVDATEALRACPAPLLYLRATRDRLVSARSRDHLLEQRPDTKVVDIDGPHLLLQTQPAECWDAIWAFLDTTPRDTTG
jgi:pimeloyl-ACP methyl ester carboxylesterase